MRAARLHSYSQQFEDPLSIEAVDDPAIEDPNDVIVRVEAAGWCQTDNHIVEGHLDAQTTLPLTLGHENAGVVEEVGDDVTLVSPGDTVLCHPQLTCGKCLACRSGEDMHCEQGKFLGISVDGGFAEYVRTTERSVVPSSSDPVDIAPHADAGISAYSAAKQVNEEIGPGDTVAVVGLGGLGHIGIQALKAISPATTIGIDLKQEALDIVDGSGANHTINASEEDVSARLTELTDGTGVTAIVDFVGSAETLDLGTTALAPTGSVHVVGTGGDLTVNTSVLAIDELSYHGHFVGSYTELRELLSLVDDGLIDAHTTEYDLERINEVGTKLKEGEVLGRAILTPTT